MLKLNEFQRQIHISSLTEVKVKEKENIMNGTHERLLSVRMVGILKCYIDFTGLLAKMEV